MTGRVPCFSLWLFTEVVLEAMGWGGFCLKLGRSQVALFVPRLILQKPDFSPSALAEALSVKFISSRESSCCSLGPEELTENWVVDRYCCIFTLSEERQAS